MENVNVFNNLMLYQPSGIIAKVSHKDTKNTKTNPLYGLRLCWKFDKLRVT